MKIHVKKLSFLLSLLVAAATAYGQADSSATQLDRFMSFQENYMNALSEQQSGNHLIALNYLKLCSQTDSTNASIPYLMSMNYLAVEDIGQAIVSAEKAHRLEPGNAQYAENLVNLYAAGERIPEAIELLVRLEKNDPKYRQDLIRLYLFSGDSKQAVRLIDESIKKDGPSDKMERLRIEALIAGEKYAYAIKQIDILLKQKDDFRLAIQKAAVLAKMNKTQDGIRFLEQYRTKNPDSAGLINIALTRILAEQKMYPESFAALALTVSDPRVSADSKVRLIGSLEEFREQGDPDGKIYGEVVENLAGQYPDNSDANLLAAELSLEQSRDSLGVKYLKKAISLGKIDFSTQMRLLISELQANMIDSLIADGERMTAVFTDQPVPFYLLGIGYQLDKDYSRALDALLRAERLSSSMPDLLKDIYPQLGTIYNELKNYEQSDRYFDLALTADPDNVVTLNNYSYYLTLRNKDLDKALGYIEKVMGTEPDNPTYLDTYAWVLYKHGDYARALSVMQRMLDKEPIAEMSSEVIFHYAEILEANGQREQAEKHRAFGREKEKQEQEKEGK